MEGSVSIRGRPCHFVAIDEAHKMCINKECKEFITRSSADYINHTALFLPVRAKAMKHIEMQLFPETIAPLGDHQIITIHASDTESEKLEMNICSQIEKLKNDSTIIASNQQTTLCHLFGKNNRHQSK